MQPLAFFIFAEKYRCENGGSTTPRSVYFFSSPGLLEHDFMKKTAGEKRRSAPVSRLECTRSPQPVGRNAPSRTQTIILQVIYFEYGVKWWTTTVGPLHANYNGRLPWQEKLFKAGPLGLSFWSFLNYLHHGIEERREASSVKTALKNSKEKLVKCATEVARLHKVSTQSCTQNRPSPKVMIGPEIIIVTQIEVLQ